MDRDTVRNKSILEDALKQINQHQVDIIVGTQMMAKGHHFHRLNLVALLDIDHSLFSSHYRAIEEMLQLITQVAGRAGRGEAQGRVLLQSKYPQHPVLQSLNSNDYHQQLEQLLDERQQHQLPPKQHWALLQARSNNKADAQKLLLKAKHWINQQPNLHCITLGPTDCVLSRKMNQHQLKLCVQSTKRSSLQQCLKQLIHLDILPTSSQQLRWFLDVDPL